MHTSPVCRLAPVGALVVAMFVAPMVWAQATLPSVTPFPLDVKRTPPSFKRADAVELQKEFVRLLRRGGVVVPDTASYDVALKELKRQDCEREDECLQQLAQRAKSLYAIYAQVDLTVDGQVSASGRVVRHDGKLVIALSTVKLAKSKESFREGARLALTRLVDEMGISKLSPVRSIDPETPDVPRMVSREGSTSGDLSVPLSPPPLILQEEGPSTMRIASYAMMGVGGASLIAGVVLVIAAQSDIGALAVNSNGNIQGAPSESKISMANAANTKTGLGAALMATGAVIGAAGGVFYFLDRRAPAVAVVPTGDGAVATMAWRLP